MRKILFLLLTLFTGVNAFSAEFEEDGISYDYLADMENSVSVANNGCNYAGDVVIPARVVHDGVTYTVRGINYQAFFKCQDLVTVSIPATVTEFGNGYNFSQCTSLTSIELPSNLTAVPDGLCWGCSSLESVTLPETVTSIGEHAFATCSALKEINLPSSIESIGKAALMGTALETFTLPEKMTELSPFCLALTTKLKSVSLHEGLKVIGECAFQGNTALTTVALPDGLETIEASAFAQCAALKDITVPDGITELPQMCFYNDMALSRVILGKKVTKIGADCFARYKTNTAAPSLKDVYLTADETVSGGESFIDDACRNATLHVPAALVEAYKAQSDWNRFSIVAITDGELSGIASVSGGAAASGTAAYSLNGTRTDKPAHGVFVSGGKKYAVK